MGMVLIITAKPTRVQLSEIHCTNEGTPTIIHSLIYTDTFKKLFNVVFAEKGSNIRPQQEEAYIHFVDFVDECAGTWHFFMIHLFMQFAIDGDISCTLEDIIVFFPGVIKYHQWGLKSSQHSCSSMDHLQHLPLVIYSYDYQLCMEVTIIILKKHLFFP